MINNGTIQFQGKPKELLESDDEFVQKFVENSAAKKGGLYE